MSAPDVRSNPCGVSSRTGLVFRGLLPQSFSDFQGRITAVLYTGGCNLRCRFCYNAPLVLEPERQPPITADEAIEILRPRTGFLDAAVVTGGEPTLEPELPRFLGRLRSLGLLTGVDTNGTNPAMLETITVERLADRLAMDFKGPLGRYGEITGREDVGASVERSLRLLASSPVPYEIRMTLHPALHSPDDVAVMARELADRGARRLALQTFKPWNVLDTSLEKLQPYSEAKLLAFAGLFEGEVTVR